MKQKSFTLKRFGFKFRMFIQNETVTACIVRLPGYDYDCLKHYQSAFVGVAKVNKPDVYNYEIGKRIAMKSAINQYSSYQTSINIRVANGFRSNMKQINERLQRELSNLRD